MYLLALAILPVYLILLFIYRKDRDKESKQLLKKLFIWGVLCAIPAFILELGIGHFFGEPSTFELDGLLLFIYIFLDIALVEEICKWVVLYKITYYHEEFDHVYDGIVYACFISLGFALIENILYVLVSGFTTALVRAITSVPGHACFAIAMGNYFSLAKTMDIANDKAKYRKYMSLSIIIPIMLHGLYDYCLLSEKLVLLIAFLVFIVVIYVYSYRVVKKLSNVKDNFINYNVINDINNGENDSEKVVVNNIDNGS